MRSPRELWWRLPVILLLIYNFVDAAFTRGNTPGKIFYCSFVLVVLGIVVVGFFRGGAAPKQPADSMSEAGHDEKSDGFRGA